MSTGAADSCLASSLDLSMWTYAKLSSYCFSSLLAESLLRFYELNNSAVWSHISIWYSHISNFSFLFVSNFFLELQHLP